MESSTEKNDKSTVGHILNHFNDSKLMKTKKHNGLDTIIILDTSGSMGDTARRTANEIIPLVLSKLSYDPSQFIHLIEFETISYLHTVTVSRLKTLLIDADGGSMMAPAVKKCTEVFKKLSGKSVRLLIISDGEVLDVPETERATREFLEFLKTKNFAINSQAVRLFTSYDQPDTTALRSLLQVNNTSSAKLIGISTTESNNSIATKIAQLFMSDSLNDGHSLFTDSTKFKVPSLSYPTSELTLIPDENIFWFKPLLPNTTRIGSGEVNVFMHAPSNLIKLQDLTKIKLLYIFDIIQLTKPVEVDESVEYISENENFLALNPQLVRFYKNRSKLFVLNF